MEKSVKAQSLGGGVPYSLDWYIVTGTASYNFYFKPRDYMGNYCEGRYVLKAFISTADLTTSTALATTDGTGITTFGNMLALRSLANEYLMLTCGTATNQYYLTVDYSTAQYLTISNYSGKVLYSAKPQ